MMWFILAKKMKAKVSVNQKDFVSDIYTVYNYYNFKTCR